MIALLLRAIRALAQWRAPVTNSTTPHQDATRFDLAGRIVRAMEQRGYAIDRGAREVNIVYLEGAGVDGERNGDAANAFNDRRMVIRFEGAAPTIVGNWQATTEPGRRYTEQPINAGGAARVAFGQYRAWQVGMHRGHHEALVQTGGPVTVCRDANKDYERDGDQRMTGFYGINQHHGYDFPADDIRSASAGCLVGRTVAGHREFMALVKSDPRYLVDKRFAFRTTILPAEWVQ
jgi:hypothetical protein